MYKEFQKTRQIGKKIQFSKQNTMMAIERVREGKRPSVVTAGYEFQRSVIYRWMKAAASCGYGLWALASRRATGRPRKLNARQEQQVFR